METCLTSPDAVMPRQMTEGAAGFDLYNCSDLIIAGYGDQIVDINVRLSIPKGCFGSIQGRSGLLFNHGIFVCNGIIDWDYRGTIKIFIKNLRNNDFFIKKGERIAQIIIMKYESPNIYPCRGFLQPTIRGENGFGSTGK